MFNPFARFSSESRPSPQEISKTPEISVSATPPTQEVEVIPAPIKTTVPEVIDSPSEDKFPKILDSFGNSARFQAGLDGKDEEGWRYTIRDTHTADARYPRGVNLRENMTNSSDGNVKTYRTLEEAVTLAKAENGPGAYTQDEISISTSTDLRASVTPKYEDTSLAKSTAQAEPNDLHSDASKLMQEKQDQQVQDNPGAG